MKIISTLLVLFVAVEHFYIAWLEMTQIPSEKRVRAVQHALRIYGTKTRTNPVFQTKACTTASSPSAWYGRALPHPITPFTARPSCSSASSSSPPHGARFHPATKAFCSNKACRHFWPPQPSLTLKHTSILSPRTNRKNGCLNRFLKTLHHNN